MMSDAEDAAGIIGDACFTKAGNEYVMRITQEDVVPEDTDLWYYFEEGLQSLELRVKNDGSVTGNIQYRSDGYYYSPYVLISADFSEGADNIYLSVDVHTKNTAKVAVTLDVSVGESQTKLRTAPPEGDTVYDVNNDPYDGFYLGMFDGLEAEIFNLAG